MSCLDKLIAYLREQQVRFSVQHHPLAYTAQEVAASEHLSTMAMTKVVVVDADGELVMLALPAAYRVDMTLVRELLDAQQLRLVDEETLAKTFLDCAVGAMPPLGHLYGLPVYVALQLAAQERIVFQAGTHTDTIEMAYADFAHLERPVVADFARYMKEMAGPEW